MARKRINAIVPEKVFNDLKELAKKKEVTMTEVLREAIALLKEKEDQDNE